MTWASALLAGLKRLSRFAGRGRYRRCQPESAGDCPTASITQPPPSQDVKRLMELRALRVNNRDPKAAAIYLQKHMILHRGRCFDE